MSGKIEKCFKSYDIRGRVPGELDEEFASRLGLAFAGLLAPKKVAVGYDIRLTSPGLAAAVAGGLSRAGVDVLDLGLCGTEEVYFATSSLGLDGGIMVTASHNPADYNGMKLVGRAARPVGRDNGLLEIAGLMQAGTIFPATGSTGKIVRLDIRPDYRDHLLSYIETAGLRPLKIVANAGNGCAGSAVDQLAARLPFDFIRMYWEPDGRFPHGVPNPLLPENREATGKAVVAAGADFGIAWDGDFDRCFLYDEQGLFIEGYYLVGLLARFFLERQPGETIIHDPRLVWNTLEMVNMAGGRPVSCRVGHTFFKEAMRREDAVYGGEMSGHHYFRDFAYCDSGMIPWLLVAEILSQTGKPLSVLVNDRQARFPVSGEINRTVDDPAAVIARIKTRYGQQGGGRIDATDGLGMEFADYRFNIRPSGTEPLLRLNVETRGNEKLLAEKTSELLALIEEKF